jgi:alkanesulfonate monooxygenase SsuD/methylene tetrahydromethanopterin reductase-like flavin-dependent oxidoreductase (luciferase family)
MAATVDEVSGGRLVMGLGAGWNEVEYRAFGLPYDHRVSRFEESFEIVRRLLGGERVTVRGRFWTVDDAVLLPPPARRVPLMIGSNGERMLSIALPHVASWNTWYAGYGNAVEGFAALNARITAAAERTGRDPAEVRRSACVLVELESDAVKRPHTDEDVAPVSADELRGHLRALADVGADEAILVLRPITERSIQAIGRALALLDG